MSQPCALPSAVLLVCHCPLRSLLTPAPRAAYDKRKYMWKLLYTRMLGYDVEFGQKQAMDLIAATG